MKQKTIVSLLLLIVITSLVPQTTVSALSNWAKIKKYNVKDIIATYTTYFEEQEKNRNQNIKLATKEIVGEVVQPGEVFSFNQVVGPRTKARGYQKAPEIVNGELVPGIGGGICQVSSTLYNAVLLSNLEIVERSPHSQPVDYIPLGRGAAVYYKQIDFKFKNNKSTPVIILGGVKQQQLTISILGRNMSTEVKIKTTKPQTLEPDTIEKIDSSLQSGARKVVQSGRDGIKVIVKRLVFNQEDVIKEEIISEDIYSPEPKIIKYNQD